MSGEIDEYTIALLHPATKLGQLRFDIAFGGLLVTQFDDGLVIHAHGGGHLARTLHVVGNALQRIRSHVRSIVTDTDDQGMPSFHCLRQRR